MDSRSQATGDERVLVLAVEAGRFAGAAEPAVAALALVVEEGQEVAVAEGGEVVVAL